MKWPTGGALRTVSSGWGICCHVMCGSDAGVTLFRAGGLTTRSPYWASNSWVTVAQASTTTSLHAFVGSGGLRYQQL